MSRRSWVDRHTGLMALLLVAFVAGAVVLSFHVWPAQAAAGDAVPYADAQATGFLTLYDKSGAAIKSGSVTDKPFVSKAVGSGAAEAPYDKTGRKATLMAYQPREGVASNQWSGDTLTASTAYGDVKHPTAQATADDFALQDFLGEFPVKWDGTIELRLYLTAPGAAPQTSGYASTDIKIVGKTWVVIGGGPGAGAGGKNIPGKVSPAAAALLGSGAAASGKPSGSADPAASASAAAGAGVGDDPGSEDVAALGDLPYLRTPGYLLISAALVIALVFGAVLLGRRRRYAEQEW